MRAVARATAVLCALPAALWDALSATPNSLPASEPDTTPHETSQRPRRHRPAMGETGHPDLFSPAPGPLGPVFHVHGRGVGAVDHPDSGHRLVGRAHASGQPGPDGGQP